MEETSWNCSFNDSFEQRKLRTCDFSHVVEKARQEGKLWLSSIFLHIWLEML